MAVHINDADALDKIISVECYDLDSGKTAKFRLDQLIEDDYTFAGFKQKYNLLSREERAQKGNFSVNGNMAIYGVMGWNRYFVNTQGEILFSMAHSNPKAQERAKRAGFTLW